MGCTSGFTIRWLVRIDVEDGRTFVVEPTDDGDLRVRIDGTDEWWTIDPLVYGRGVASEGAVVGRTLRWWHQTTGEAVIVGRPPARLVRPQGRWPMRRYPAVDRRAMHERAVDTRLADDVVVRVHDAEQISAVLVAVVAPVVRQITRDHHARHARHSLGSGISP